MANPALVGNEAAAAANASVAFNATGLRVLKQELGQAGEALKSGLVVGAFELATGGNKVKAVWESIKWAALARAGLAGVGILLGAFIGLTTGIRSAILASGLLQASMDRLGSTKLLTGQFTQFLGSVTAAKQRVAELYTFVANSKFGLGEVVEASKALTIMSAGARGGERDLKMLGQVATNSGVSLSEITLAYGRLNQQTRNNQDISGTVDELKNLGVFSETAAAELSNLSQTGASGAAIFERVEEIFKGISNNTGDTTKSFEELQKAAGDAQSAMALAFGSHFIESERKSLQGTVDIMHGLTPAIGEVGKMLSYVTGLVPYLKTKMADISKNDWFAGAAKSAAQFALILPAVAAGWQVAKGAFSLGKTTVGVFKTGRESGVGGFKAVGQTALGAVSPAQGARNLAASATKLELEYSALLTKQLELEALAELRLAEAKSLTSKASVAEAAGEVVAAEAHMVAAQAAQAEATSLQVAADAQGIFAAKTQVGAKFARGGSIALTGFSEGLKKAGSYAATAGSWLLKMAGPMLVVTGISIAASIAWNKWSEAMERAKHSRDMDADAAAGSKSTDEQVKHLKTAEDRTKLLTNANEALTASLEEQVEVMSRLASSEAERASSAAKVAAKQRDVSKIQNVDPRKLGMGAFDYERSEREAASRKSIKEINFQGQMNIGTDARKVELMQARREELSSMARDIEGGRAVEGPIRDTKVHLKTAEDQRETAVKGTHAAEAALEKERPKSSKEEIQAAIGIYKQTGRSKEDLMVVGVLMGQIQKIEEIDKRIAEIRSNRAKLEKEGSTSEIELRQELADLQEKGNAADRKDREARAALVAGDVAAQKRLTDEANDLRQVTKESAEQEIAAIDAQLAAMAQGRQLRQSELDAAKAMRDITEETADAENKKLDAELAGIQARQQILALEGPKELKGAVATADQLEANPATKDTDTAKNARAEVDRIQKQQATDSASNEGDLAANRSRRAEVQRAHDRNMATWTDEIKAHELNQKAIVAAAKGNFAQADAALKEAQDIQDKRAMANRRLELAPMHGPKEAESMVHEEQKQRDLERSSQANAFRATEGRRATELELGNQARGIGLSDGTSSEARKKLTGMQDFDSAREQALKNMQELGPGHVQEAVQMALRTSKAEILGQTVQGGQQGAGSVGDSLTRVGGGGGFYAGATGDPVLSATKRIGDLTARSNELLAEIAKSGGVKVN